MFYMLLLFENRCKDVYLPDVSHWTGSIMLPSIETHWKKDITIPVRALDGEWYLVCPDGFSWEDKTIKTQEIQIRNRVGVVVSKNGMQIKIQFIACRLSDTVFKKFLLPKDGRVLIGRDSKSDIAVNDEAISTHHGTLIINGNGCQYKDQDSRLGSFINGLRLTNENRALRFGDVITLPSGFKLIYLGSIIAINNANRIQSISLSPAVMKTKNTAEMERDKKLPQMIKYHHRMVRIVEKRDEEPIEVEAPITMQAQNEQPMILTLGPSLTMMVPMGLTILVGARSPAGLVMVGGSSAMAVMWGVINARYRHKKAAEAENKRRRIYTKYIAEMDELLRDKYDKELNRLLLNNPDVGQCAAMPSSNPRRLWERMPAHVDFSEVRLGRGDVPMPNQISFPKEKLSMVEDPLRENMKRLDEAYRCIKNAPVTLKLMDNPIVGILGKSMAKEVAKSIVVQLAALHSYHDLKICILADDECGSEWQWARWLPHVFASEDRLLRMVVANASGRQAVLSYLDEVISIRVASLSERKDQGDEEKRSEALLPHYVVVCTNPELLENKPLLRTILSTELGFTLIMLADGVEHLPKECMLMIDTESGNVLTADGDSTTVDLEYSHDELLKQFSESIAPIRVKASTEDAAIPTLVTFLEIYGVKNVNELDVWRFWNENKAYDGLKSIIGYRAGSQPFILDISDKAHGPHGLVAGTTGSGKSVMLETYILSLALNYSPDMVRFILIDYKGGGMADTFKDLPHVTGIIDNLQGERVIQRALASIEGEIHRRERIFKETGVNNIHDYIRFFGDDPKEEKLPHLIVIVDEFAELKSEQPDFMAKLVSASRVGRSLGLHLILATQKPAGSVSPEIEANTNFRICLRVQSRGDSMDMLHRPEAAYIKGMGRCYIKVGNDEIFEQVQTSYSGAEYNPNETDTRFLPKLLDDAGQVVNIKKKKKKTNEKVPTQMGAVLDLISRITKEHGMTDHHMLWQPILGKMLHMDDLKEFKECRFTNGIWPNPDGSLAFPFAIADDVANQRYITAWVDLTASKNLMLVGLAGTGKTTLIQTMVYSLVNRYSPEHLNIYIMSLSSRTLGNLLEFPQVGDIVFGGEEHEVYRMLDMLKRECEQRKRKFEAAYVNGFVEYNRARKAKGQSTEPAIVVFIDRMQQLRDVIENNEEVYADFFTLIREGSSSGLYFVISSLGGNEIPLKLRDAFNGIALQLRERSDYNEVLGVRVPVDMDSIAPINGRGMALVGETPYEIQILLAAHAETDIDRINSISELARLMNTAWKGNSVKGIARIPDDPTFEQFSLTPGYIEAKNDMLMLPVAYGINSGDARVIDLQTEFSYLITGGRKTGKTNALMCIAKEFIERGGQVYVIGSDEWMQFIHENGLTRLMPESQDCIEFINSKLIEQYIKPRNAAKKTAVNKAELRKIAASHQPIAFIFDDIDAYLDITKNPNFANAVRMIGFMCTDAANCGIYTFMSVSANSLNSVSRQNPVSQLIGQGRGIALGGKFGDCDVWNVPNTVMNYKQKNALLPKGTGYIIASDSVEQIVFPLLVEK